MKNARAYIGTSGWNYGHWKEVFYPRGVRQSDWLGYYARHFDTAEVNNSFYRIPASAVVAHWIEQVPARFRFAVKLWRGITQFRKLRECGEYLENFFDAFRPLPAQKRGPLLVQLPPHMGRNDERLDSFLDEVRQVTAPERWKVAVEFRNESWLCRPVYRILDRHRAALCLHDMAGRAPVSEPNDASFVYVRRHGPTGSYSGRYTQEHIDDDARRVRAWLDEGRTVYVYYNNDVAGHAVHNALQLRVKVEG